MARVTLDLNQDDDALRKWSESISDQLELGRQAFVMLWNKYNFQVKTAHESLEIYGTAVEDRATAVRLSPHLLSSDADGAADYPTAVQSSGRWPGRG